VIRDHARGTLFMLLLVGYTYKRSTISTPSNTILPNIIMYPYRRGFYLTYAILSAVAFYYMRLGPASKITANHIEPLINGIAPSFRYPGRTEVIRQYYTGIKPVDGLLSVLVTAFLSGSAGWRFDIQVQQINFLTSWTSVLVVWSLESVRRSNSWSFITLYVTLILVNTSPGD